jgi:hypothetical protein
MNTNQFINPSQLGGIESYTFADGPARNTRALLVNTGAGLRYRLLPDRGLDIDQAFFHQHSLTFLAHKGVTPPQADALRHGLDWLRGFPVGLLTSCGPTNIGGPATDNGETVGLHGPHSGTPATIESIIQPDPRAGRLDMTVVARFRYGAFYGPCIDMRRTLTSTLGQNHIDIHDEFFNAGNEDQPHAWLLHINFGYPLLDEGAEFCVATEKLDPVTPPSPFWQNNTWKRITAPRDDRKGAESTVAYLTPKAAPDGKVTVGIINPKLNLGVAVRYNANEFPRCVNWQHLGPHEYVAALEPANGGVQGRDKDRANAWLDTLKAGAKKTYRYEFEVLQGDALTELRTLNR